MDKGDAHSCPNSMCDPPSCVSLKKTSAEKRNQYRLLCRSEEERNLRYNPLKGQLVGHDASGGPPSGVGRQASPYPVTRVRRDSKWRDSKCTLSTG